MKTRRTVKISDVANVFDGPHATPSKTVAGPLFLGITCLEQGRLNIEAADHVSEDDYLAWTRRVEPRAGDVVFSYETKIGEAALIPPGLRCCLGRRMGLVRPRDDRIDARFFLYQYLGPEFQAFLASRTIHGSTVDRIALRDFPSFEIFLPPLEQQRAIAEALSALDNKIELNRRISQTLEAIAQAIFKSWFVDFQPALALADGQSLEYVAERFGLTPETTKFFSTEIDEQEGRIVPASWKLSTLGQETKAHGGLLQTGPFGSQLHAADYTDEGVPVAMPQDLINRRIATNRIARVSHHTANVLKRHMLAPGDVVYSRRGDVERHALVTAREAGWLCGTGCLLVRMGSAWPSHAYLSESLNDPLSREWIVRHAVGATMPNLNTSILASLPLLVPPSPVLQHFEIIVGSLWAQQEALSLEAESLAALRDELLPRLLSGELVVT